MVKFPITKKGFELLEKEIKHLKHIERPSIIEAISTAREFGDLSENAEYHAAREKQSFVEGRILDLEDKLSRADIINTSKLSKESVKFGATVKLMDDDTEEEATYVIVGEYEADIIKKRVSIQSPIAKGLIGKAVGDIVEVITPNGKKVFEILEISYQDINLD
jgi:transcription elongation factor GreA